MSSIPDTDDTTIYSCLNSMSDVFDTVKLADALENDLHSVVIWDKKWLVNFSASKMEIISFNHLRKTC